MQKLKLARDEGRKGHRVRKMFREGHAEEVASKWMLHKVGCRGRAFPEPGVMDLRGMRGEGRSEVTIEGSGDLRLQPPAPTWC